MSGSCTLTPSIRRAPTGPRLLSFPNVGPVVVADRRITRDGLAFQPTQSGKNLKWWCVRCHGKNAKSYRRRTAASVSEMNEAWLAHQSSSDHLLAVAVGKVIDAI